MQRVGIKLGLDATALKKLFGVVKNHSYTEVLSSPMVHGSAVSPRVLKRSQLDSREEFAEDVAEALHDPQELARKNGNPPPAPSRAQKKRTKALFKIIDKNSDGELSAEEISASFPQV